MHALKQNVNPDNNDTPHVTWAQQRHTSRHLVALCFLLSFKSNYLQAALQPPIPGVCPSAPQYRHHRGPFFPGLDELRVLAALVKQVDECLRMNCSSTSTFCHRILSRGSIDPERQTSRLFGGGLDLPGPGAGHACSG